jgi:hypothetical protein
VSEAQDKHPLRPKISNSRSAAGEYLENRASRGNRRKFERALGKVKDVEPEERDRLSARE